MTRGASDKLPFAYDDFNAWYESYRRAALEPARQTFCRILGEEMRRLEVEFGPGRFREPISRLKDPVRLWAKMHLPKYDGRITSLEVIPEVIDDLVGVRIVCTNKSDVRKLRDVLDRMGRQPFDSQDTYGVAVETGSERDYLAQPKPSGYRAYHLNLMTAVPRIGGTTPVKGELQVRTLLQDGWGELTHEDTYKPDQRLPELVGVLSLRMGELLATVDDIAEDIQLDLSRLSQEAVREPAAAARKRGKNTSGAELEAGSIAPEIVLAEAARTVSLLETPTSLAQVAAHLRATFGEQIVDGWLGHGTFKNFLIAAVPDVNVVPKGPSYIIPPGVAPDDDWPQVLRG